MSNYRGNLLTTCEVLQFALSSLSSAHLPAPLRDPDMAVRADPYPEDLTFGLANGFYPSTGSTQTSAVLASRLSSRKTAKSRTNFFTTEHCANDSGSDLCPIRIRNNEASPVPGLLIPVPSRWQHRQPHGSCASLHGKRALLKDIFDVRGLRVSACNRAYLQISRLASRTSPMIQELIDAGVFFVGKAKLSSLISREEPSESIFVEFPVPENPRGDCMQSPAGSSSGSAAAVAAYDWLDFALGSDCMYSIRTSPCDGKRADDFSDWQCEASGYGEWVFCHPLIHGRSSVARHDAMFPVRNYSTYIALTYRLRCRSIFDSPAIFARDLREIHNVTSCWCSNQLGPAMKVGFVAFISMA